MEELYSDIQDLLQLEEADPYNNDESAPEQEAELLETKIEEENIQPTLKLDYKLKTCAERADLVNRIVAQTPQENLTNRYLEILGDYIMGGITKEEKKDHLYITDNRRITIDRRETSFEGLAEKFENGEDGIYGLITNDKNIIFQHKQEITPEDIETIPGLKELRAAMQEIEEAGKVATGKQKFLLKKQLIEMRKDQYILKNSFKPPIKLMPSSIKGINKIDLSETRYLDENGVPQSTGLISFFNPQHISAILCNYNALKIETRGKYQNDFYYLLNDFDVLLQKALKDYPMYLALVQFKINKKSSADVQKMLLEKFGISHSIQYISALWRNKIPKIIAEYAQQEFLIWYYETQEQGPMKRCACCKQLKPANNKFFSHNKTAKDGWYAWCKVCRNTKKIKTKDKIE